jgi:hypothetical protein
LARVTAKSLQDLVDSVEAPYMFRQPRPVKVDIAYGVIRMDYMLEDTGALRARFDITPLESSDFFTSFAKLHAHGKPSTAKIRNWVSRFGLPDWNLRWEFDGVSSQEGGDEPRDRSSRNPLGSVSMTVEDFQEEARYAHDLLKLYTNITNDDASAIRSKVKATNPSDELGESRLDREFREKYKSNRRKWLLVEGRHGPREYQDLMVLLTAQTALGDIVTARVSRVRLRAGIQRGGSLSPSWECHDLPSALYLQFYLMVTRHKPIRYCKYCGQPFEATRKDKSVCGPSCRSALRYERRKNQEKGEAN